MRISNNEAKKGSTVLQRNSSTIKQVADLAGVSQMTVSRVLNNHELVKQSTRQRVYDAIRHLNYRPSIMARNLANRKSLYITLLYTNPSAGYLGELLLGALSACREKQHLLMVDRPNEELMKAGARYFEKSFLQSSVQALLIAPPLSENIEFMTYIRDAGIPHVSISPMLCDTGISVRIDDEAAAVDMTNHLIDLGHHDIAFIQGPENHGASQFRFKGFIKAMKAKGLPAREEWITPGDFTCQSGYTMAQRVLQLERKPTAIFASNDEMASGAIGAASELGLRVPRDVSIVGFDDVPIASTMWPRITTVQQPIRRMAEIGIELFDLYIDRPAPRTICKTVDHTIIIRDSAQHLSAE